MSQFTQYPQRRLKFIGCEIVYREASRLAAACPHQVDVQFLGKTLHDLPTEEMRRKLQEAIDAVGPEYEAILLGYARCNDGTVGLTARNVPIVIPRAHDCITFFFGGRHAYKDYFDAHPGTYFHTTGWLERGSSDRGGEAGVLAQLGLNQGYAELVAKYGKENADFIAATMGDLTANYRSICYLRMDACDESDFVKFSQAMAAEKGWTFDGRQGDWSVLEKLFLGPWDDDFVVLQPGQTLAARNDERVLEAE